MNKKNITIIGHRGGVSSNGENTLEVFQQGFINGVNIVECDLNITKDGVIFIYHDPYIKIDGNKKYTKDLLYKELLSYKPDICTLEDLLNTLGNKLFIFELKDDSNYKKIIDNFSAKNETQFAKNRFISFSLEALKYVKSKDKNIYCSYIGTSAGDNNRIEPFILQKHIDGCVTNNIEELSGHWLTFTPSMMRKTHEKGIKVGLGPINSKMAYRCCINNNIDYIYTDNGSKISQFLI